MTTVTANGVDLGIESFGDDDAPLVLLAGGTTMLSWPDELCERLAAGGRRLVRYDLRDSGASTTADPEAPGYTLRDLAADAAALVGALGGVPGRSPCTRWRRSKDADAPSLTPSAPSSRSSRRRSGTPSRTAPSCPTCCTSAGWSPPCWSVTRCTPVVSTSTTARLRASDRGAHRPGCVDDRYVSRRRAHRCAGQGCRSTEEVLRAPARGHVRFGDATAIGAYVSRRRARWSRRRVGHVWASIASSGPTKAR